MSLNLQPGTARFINPLGLYDPAPHGYSHLALTQGPLRWLLAAGQGGENASGELPAGFEAQLQQCLANVQTVLAAGGAGLGDVLRLRVLIVDHDERRLVQLGAALRALWGEAPTPACTLIPVPRLALDGMLVEIEATAALPP